MRLVKVKNDLIVDADDVLDIKRIYDEDVVNKITKDITTEFHDVIVACVGIPSYKRSEIMLRKNKYGQEITDDEYEKLKEPAIRYIVRMKSLESVKMTKPGYMSGHEDYYLNNVTYTFTKDEFEKLNLEIS